MSTQFARRNRKIESFCGNPDCQLHYYFNEDAIESGKMIYPHERPERTRIITRKLYVGISGKGSVWFCSVCAGEIEQLKKIS